ncbi:laccase domain-containing protein 1 [Carassius auratus]|uniref:Purine nucleoside phosphorylase LACC1 n=1 Tax=Carassius auratus TaxID=7957 RepID=A0A6P6KPU9_CARAU|nr:laccase domain-containing protein 1-like [Carassius auratus]XP_026074318.1 laccase domain-containing protein 1-like [Carassius auratus]XP_026074319.1 laccase domain-containing protein 1-like [Carassius auratus]XP_026074320.1 laccase domain-containing protein 1-like [Carassius auratus]
MTAATLVDLTHVRSSHYDTCVKERIGEFCASSGNGSREPVFFISDPDRSPSSSLQEMFIGFRDSPQILCKSSLSAALYSFKQAIDKEDISKVKIVTSSRGRGLFQVYQELLFTSAYEFEYSVMFDSLSCECESECCPSGQRSTADAARELSTFLQQLPALGGDVTVLRSPFISDCFGHGFSTRTGGISYISTLSSLNLFCNPRRKDPRAVVAENIRRLGLQAGFLPKQFNLIKCNHASDVWVMGKPAPDSYDAMVTNQVGVVIAAPGADCMPLLFTDPVAKVIGVAHAGWKGTLMGVAIATVNAMVSEFGSRPEDIVCVIGPSVGPCCFTLDQDSAREFHAIHPDCVRHIDSSRPYVDIRLATRVLLERGGIKAEHMEDIRVPHEADSTLCTSCRPELFFSHVRDGLNFGTQIGFVWIK